MCLSLYDYHSKAFRYSNGFTYLKNRVTKNQKHTIDLQKNKKERTQAWQKENCQTTKGKTKRNKEEIQNQLENKVENGNKHISINNYLKCQWSKCSDQKT